MKDEIMSMLLNLTDDEVIEIIMEYVENMDDSNLNEEIITKIQNL